MARENFFYFLLIYDNILLFCSCDDMTETFVKHFEKYGDIVDSVIMKDRYTNKPRGFGFITYKDASVVDRVIEDTHIINGKTVCSISEIIGLLELNLCSLLFLDQLFIRMGWKRVRTDPVLVSIITIPKGAAPLKDFKTRKIFVGGIPTTLTEDEFKNFFSEFGRVEDHEIIRDHTTNRSRGFGFVVFEKEKDVDDLLAKRGNMIDLAGSKVSLALCLIGRLKVALAWASLYMMLCLVEIKKAEPKKSGNAPPPAFGGESRARHFGDSFGGFGGNYGGFGGGGGGGGGSGYGPSSYRTPGGYGPRPGGGYGGYGSVAGEFGGYAGGLGDYRGESSLGYTSRFGSYGEGFGGEYGGGGFG
ncbi:hypothetical protein GW17_00056905, partial [Ensete ventricosum]